MVRVVAPIFVPIIVGIPAVVVAAAVAVADVVVVVAAAVVEMGQDVLPYRTK